LKGRRPRRGPLWDARHVLFHGLKKTKFRRKFVVCTLTFGEKDAPQPAIGMDLREEGGREGGKEGRKEERREGEIVACL